MITKEFESLMEFIKLCYPESYDEITSKKLISENLFSPFQIDLPKSVLEDVTSFVAETYKIKESKDYQEQLKRPEDFSLWPKTPSILSCFDFHYSPEMGLKLIEINTNASLYLPVILQRCAQANHCVPPQFDILFDSFVDTFKLSARDGISIFDEDPEKEGLYFEFLIFKEWLTQKGYDANIVSLKSFPEEAHKNVYNRFTDFYFERPESADLLAEYIDGARRFSPNPREYFLMADKRRQMSLKKQLALENPQLASMIPEAKKFSEFESKDDLWAQRKKYFLKPSHSFGSKGVFKGKGISRKAFENLYHPEYIAQELCPAGKRTFEYNSESYEMKYDLRFFTYNGQIQNYTARLYQGQATNMRTKFGGLAPIMFT